MKFSDGLSGKVLSEFATNPIEAKIAARFKKNL